MEDRIGKRLARGVARARIAAELGISPSTVTRHARLLGYPDARRRPSITDWSRVQAYYDEGHSIDECRLRFGFSYGAWDKAVVRGDLVTRSRRNGELGLATRDQVEGCLARGMSQAQVSRELGLAKSTVAYHARRLGRRADPRFARRHDWSAVQRAIDDEGLSMRTCRDRFGFSVESWRRAVGRGEIIPRPHTIPLADLLVAGRLATNRSYLKRRLIVAGLKEDRCERCGLTEWHGQRLPAQLHHVNGDKHDNRITNLSLLCPNCHALTANWGGRNKRAGANAPDQPRSGGGESLRAAG
jgi:DNA-binding CsgD family transcriptional regulator